MTTFQAATPHSFHIPVMGTGFTIDTPLRVARYGISSVISLVDDILIEKMRRFHCEKAGEPFEPISEKAENHRAMLIRAYLNLVDRLVAKQVAALQAAPFEPGSEITRYFDLLPDGPLRVEYESMLACTDMAERRARQEALRAKATPGSIDVNIMSKADADVWLRGKQLPPEFSHASTALRGFATSTLRSTIVFSAGMNPRLYGYLKNYEDFFPDAQGDLRKKVCLKVSDFRSALIQGKYLAKRGIWISEFRVESGLNCGGHAFGSGGHLMGPILEEFREQRATLYEQMSALWVKALDKAGREVPGQLPPTRITAQGGIGTAAEDEMLLRYYALDGTGWATPFMLVPEVANVDDDHLRMLSEAGDKDVFMSDSSPLGLPFWSLRRSASEEAKRARIAAGKPGSLCPQGFVRLDNQLGKVPLCRASRAFQKRMLKKIDAEDLPPEVREERRTACMAKACICKDLAGGATLKNHIDPEATAAVCCGPNIVNFSKIATLEEMVGHIYGRLNLLTNSDRPHLFIKELSLYVDYFAEELRKVKHNLGQQSPKYFTEFKESLLRGVAYYRDRAKDLAAGQHERFQRDLKALAELVENLPQLVEEHAGAIG